MQNYWWCAMLFRIFLPCAIATAGFFRPTITSYVYMIMGCYMPFFSVPTKKTMAADTGGYIKLLMVVCMLMCSLVSSFYFVLYYPSDPAFDLKYCSPLEILIRTVGVIQYEGLPIKEAITWCLPEPLMLITSILLFVAFKRLTRSDEGIDRQATLGGSLLLDDGNRKKILNMMRNFGKYLVCFLLCITSILRPNVIGGVYYVTFLIVLSYWACNQSLGKAFARIIACSIPVLFLNITILFVYQFQYFQDSDLFQDESFTGRLFNFVSLKTYKSCEDPRLFQFHSQSDATYVMPFCIFILYYSTILVTRDILQAKDGILNLLIAIFFCEKRRNIDIRWQIAIKKLQQRLDNDKATSTESDSLVDQVRLIIDHVLHFIFSISHLAANFMMMIWAIAFVGWKSLILLLLANLVWLMPSRKRMMLIMSPFLAIFMYFLLISAYIYSLEVSRDELPSNVGPIDFRSGINEPNSQKWIELLAKSMLGVLIFTSMRRLLQERAMINLEELESTPGTSAMTTALGDTKRLSYVDQLRSSVVSFFAIWWIWIVVVTMLWMEFWAMSNLFRIAFVGLVVMFLITFQLCPFAIWKKFLWFYWWIVIIYSMFNLLILYMYQMKGTRKMLFLMFTQKQYESFGCVIWRNKIERFFALANPLFFQIAIIIQQNYFQKEFDKLTSPVTPEEVDEKEKQLLEFGSKRRQLITTFNNFTDIFFAILEIHLLNAILLIGWYMCVSDLCALFAPCVLLFTLSCLMNRRFCKVIVYFISVFVQLFIIARLIYMNQNTNHSKWDVVGFYKRNGKHFNVTLNTADWLGLHKSSLGQDFADLRQLAWCFGFVFAVIVDRIVTVRMQNYRKSRNLQSPEEIVLFPNNTNANAYDSLGNMLKFLANYGFYKFGCEITFITASIAMAMRMDAVAIPLGLWLLIMFALNRKWMKRLWFPLLLVMVFAIPIQYFNSLGWWPTNFYSSNTIFWNSNDFRLRLQQFCHIMNMAHPPIKEKISQDFVLLLIMSRQWWAFRKERIAGHQHDTRGSNESVHHLIDDPNIINPVSDFTTYTKNYFDTCNIVFFSSWFYWSLMAAFFAGMMRPSLYSFGFIFCASVFLWESSDIYLRPPNKILLRWNFLLGYNIMVMIARTTSQVFGCVLKYNADIQFNCEIFKFFAVGCVDKYKMTEGVPNLSSSASCTIHYEALGIGWDCVCFFCLIWQQRIFKSYYFIHLVNDMKARTILADRGAELIEETRRKRREAVDAERIAIENNIAKKMERIVANYDKIEAIRAGEYYYFDQVDKDIDIPLVPPKVLNDEEDYYPYDPMPLGEYFGLFFFANIATVLEITEIRRHRKKALQNKAQGKPVAKITKPTNKEADFGTDLSSARKTMDFLRFLWGAFESVVVSVIGIMDRATRNFRNILYEINKDIVILKEQTNYKQGVRIGSNKIWYPADSYKEILNEQRKKATNNRDYMHYSIYVKFFTAVWYLFMAYSEWFCYLLIILYQTLLGNLISIPMLWMTFCWGALTVPKPTKTFWVVNIACALIIVLLKNFFDMDITPWTKNDKLYTNFFPPVLIGLFNKMKFLNVMLLFTLFFHRVVLRKLGLWKPYDYRTTSLLPDGDYQYKDGVFTLSSTGTRKNQQILSVQSVAVPMGDYFPKSIVHGLFKYAEGFRLYIQQLIYPSSTQIPVDVYLPMFLCDLLNLFLLLFFFGSFEAKADQLGLLQYIKHNKVPFLFTISVLIYMGLMMIDRAIYLRRNRFAKLTYHFFQVIGYHLWFFIIDPLMANRRFRDSRVVQTFYAFKCLYFLFSAYQIRNGYPTLISYHYLWHGYTIFHRFGYKLYRFIPYFLEIRCLLDWICSDSSLDLAVWFKMEDVTQNLFDQKCQQEFESKWSQPGGQRQNRTTKLLVGGLLYMLLIFTLIFPFLLFSLSSTVGITTHPEKMKLEVAMGRSQLIFEAYVIDRDIIHVSKEEYLNISTSFNSIATADEIFDAFKPEDVLVVKWSTNSLTTWDISPGSRNELLEELQADEPVMFRLEIHYIHIGNGGQQSERVFGQTSYVPALPNADRQNLIDIVKSKDEKPHLVWLPLIFPKFLKIDKGGYPEVLTMMEPVKGKWVVPKAHHSMEGDDDEDLPPDPTRLRNLLINLRHSKSAWWQISEECTMFDDNYVYYLTNLVHNDCNSLVLYLFNEKVFSNALHFMTRGGILGLYLIYFMVIINIIRSFRGNIANIWIDELPNSNKVLRKCMEIYVARDMKHYQLEQEIFEEITCIMRSRELMIKLTRYEDNNYDPTFITPGTSRK